MPGRGLVVLQRPPADSIFHGTAIPNRIVRDLSTWQQRTGHGTGRLAPLEITDERYAARSDGRPPRPDQVRTLLPRTGAEDDRVDAAGRIVARRKHALRGAGL